MPLPEDYRLAASIDADPAAPRSPYVERHVRVIASAVKLVEVFARRNIPPKLASLLVTCTLCTVMAVHIAALVVLVAACPLGPWLQGALGVAALVSVPRRLQHAVDSVDYTRNLLRYLTTRREGGR